MAVCEAFVTLQYLLGDRSPTLAEAMMFESFNRVITAVFKFVPLRVGVDEAASGGFAALVSPVAGVALALVCKERSLFWMGIGLRLIAFYHSGAVPSPGRHGGVPAPRT